MTIRERICSSINARRWDVELARRGNRYIPFIVWRRTGEGFSLPCFGSLSKSRALKEMERYFREGIVKRSDFC